jgi:hypothetical protein
MTTRGKRITGAVQWGARTQDNRGVGVKVQDIVDPAIADALAALLAALLPIPLDDAAKVTGLLPLTNVDITFGAGLTLVGTQLQAAGGSGTGDVIGPAASVDLRIAVFDGTSGKLLADGGATVAELATQAQVLARASLRA